MSTKFTMTIGRKEIDMTDCLSYSKLPTNRLQEKFLECMKEQIITVKEHFREDEWDLCLEYLYHDTINDLLGGDMYTMFMSNLLEKVKGIKIMAKTGKSGKHGFYVVGEEKIYLNADTNKLKVTKGKPKGNFRFIGYL